MNVGIDGRALQGSRAGVGRYVFELCRALDVEMPEARFFVYSHIPVEMPVVSDRWTLRVEANPIYRTMRSFVWLKTRAGVLCREDDVAGFWGCASFIPRLPKKTRSVITVHDLNYRLVPDTMHTAAVWQYRLFFRRDLAKADSVLANSQGTSDRIREYDGRSADGVVYPAVSPIFSRQSDADVRECLQRYKLTFPYVLAVATWEPRKNLELLLTTLAQIHACGELGQRRLVLVGGRGWKNDRLTALVRDHPDLVHPLGYVPDQDLPMLYSGADAFVFPSTYEGFGMPVLEARACGTPVVTTDTPELREAGGPDAVYVRPTIEGIRSGLRQVLSSGRRPSGVFERPTWADGARTLAAALRGTL